MRGRYGGLLEVDKSLSWLNFTSYIIQSASNQHPASGPIKMLVAEAISI